MALIKPAPSSLSTFITQFKSTCFLSPIATINYYEDEKGKIVYFYRITTSFSSGGDFLYSYTHQSWLMKNPFRALCFENDNFTYHIFDLPDFVHALDVG